MKIVFPVAGVGTRFLPATKEVPKEILPVIDKPLIQYAVEEAVAKRLRGFRLHHRPRQGGPGALFRPQPRAGRFPEAPPQDPPAGRRCRNFTARISSYIRQEQALGFGHAIALAEKAVGDEAFAISLPDDLILSEQPVMAQLIEVYEKYQSPVIAFMEVPPPRTSPRYGIAAGTFMDEQVFRIEKLVEKPAAADAPSNFAVIGRYILTPDIFPLLKRRTTRAPAPRSS